jgi:hypothetical protein
MRKQVKSILFVLSCLFIGALPYFFFRPPFSWLPVIGRREEAIADISWMPLFMSDFVLYHLSDVLWALALAETAYLIKKNLRHAVAISFASTALFETMQYFGVIRGTGDIWDIIFAAISLVVYFFFKKGVCKNEKGT